MNKLQLVGEVLRDRESRCVGSLAVTAGLEPVDPNHESACRWCISGAVMKVVGHSPGAEECEPFNALYKQVVDLLMLPTYPIHLYWDNASDETRDAIVQKLLES